MRPIVGYIKPYIPRMGVGIFFKFVGTIMELMIPWILSYILDYVVPQKNTRLVLFWGLLMVLSAIAALVGNILANRISASVARDTTRTLRHDLFKKISYLSSAQIDQLVITEDCRNNSIFRNIQLKQSFSVQNIVIWNEHLA